MTALAVMPLGPILREAEQEADRRIKDKILARSRSTIQGCWFWEGFKTHEGYGRIWAPELKQQLAHRVSYIVFVGPIPEGATIDHLCGSRACVNPAHLEPVSRVENVMRGNGVCARQSRQTHCKRGHELTPENTYSPPSRPDRRECRRCRTAYQREYQRARRADA